ncbi:hypothetical protein CBR_g37254 [Chara braunii]|uniref:Uncharacterized protein n=1 Tax=Chara braunii TaxID=69332 RepID=A0A388LMK1_CHABU|nr:hypothetical protein CBR_g37254 [Chara braunii]|eukprot:GBG83538.1 hypothetical protein CBR_g37254 [Chara braunii]
MFKLSMDWMRTVVESKEVISLLWSMGEDEEEEATKVEEVVVGMVEDMPMRGSAAMKAAQREVGVMDPHMVAPTEPSNSKIGRVRTFMDLAAVEQERITVAAEQQRLAEEAAAEQQRLPNEAAAKAQQLANEAAVQAQLQREADEAAQQQQRAASTQVLQNEEQRFSELLTNWTFVPSAAQPAPTAAEQEKTELAYLLRHLLHIVNWQQEQLRRHAQTSSSSF